MSRIATILVCSVARDDAQLIARVGDLLSRHVYSSGGKVVDSDGVVQIAEFELASDAVAAATSTLVALGSEPGDLVSMAIAEGEIEDRDFTITGRGLETALALADSVQQGRIGLPKRLVGEASGYVEGALIGTLGGESYVILEPAPVAPPVPPTDGVESPSSRGQEGGKAERHSPEQEETKAGRSRAVPLPLLTSGLVVLAVLVAAVWFLFGRSEDGAVDRVATNRLAPVSGEQGRSGPIPLALQTVETEDEVTDLRVFREMIDLLLRHETAILLDPAASTRLELERVEPSSMDEAPAEGESAQETMIRARLSGKRSGDGPIVDPSQPILAASETVSWLAETLEVEIVEYDVPESNELRAAVAAAVVDRDGFDTSALEDAIREQGDYGPAFALLAERYEREDQLSLRVEALRRLAEARPGDDRIWRSLATLLTENGRIGDAVRAWDRVLRIDPSDSEALEAIALVAMSVGDRELVERIRNRFDGELPIHEGDYLDLAGDVNAAVRMFYETESNEPENTLTPFRVGRIGVMRRSTSVAALELEKLTEKGIEPDASYLEAYIAADAGDRVTAERALERAIAAAEWCDSPGFHEAEVRALLRDSAGTVRAIDRSVQAGEPRMSYIPSDPLFQYLSSSPEFRGALIAIEAKQREIRGSLSELGGI